jgi:glycosyltransferase involved in cell wall biosynthesis
MKILFVLEDFNSSGVTKITKLFAESMVKIGIQVDVLLLKSITLDSNPYSFSYINNLNKKSSKNIDDEEKINFSALKKVLKFIFGRFFYLFLFSSSPNKFKNVINKYDLIFICDLYSKFYFWKIRSKNLRLVLHNIKSKQIGSIGGLGKFLDKWLFKRALLGRQCIAVSNAVKDDIVSHFKISQNNILVIHNPLFFINHEDVKSIKLFEREYFLFAGRLSKQKRIDLLLESYAIFRFNNNKSPIPDLIILGVGPLRKKLEKLTIDLKIEAHVKFVGYKNNIYDYIINSKAVLLTSEYEGFPTIVVEALINKKFVLSVPIPSLIEMKNYFQGIFLSTNESKFSFANLLNDFLNLNLENHEANCINPIQFDLNNNTIRYLEK